MTACTVLLLVPTKKGALLGGLPFTGATVRSGRFWLVPLEEDPLPFAAAPRHAGPGLGGSAVFGGKAAAPLFPCGGACTVR